VGHAVGRALRPAAIAAGLALVVLPAAAAKPAFEPGPYAGAVAVRGKPPLTFVATRTRVRRLSFDAQAVRCSDGRRGAINLPGPVAKRSARLRHARFDLRYGRADHPAQAGSRVAGRLRGKRASGTVRMVLRLNAATGAIDPAGTVVCDTGKLKWTAKRGKPGEVWVDLP
jgi:hypothetical protein